VVNFEDRPPIQIHKLVAFRIASAPPEQKELMRTVGERIVNTSVSLGGDSVRQLDPAKVSEFFYAEYHDICSEVQEKLKRGEIKTALDSGPRRMAGRAIVWLLVHPESRGTLKYNTRIANGRPGFFFFKERTQWEHSGSTESAEEDNEHYVPIERIEEQEKARRYSFDH